MRQCITPVKATVMLSSFASLLTAGKEGEMDAKLKGTGVGSGSKDVGGAGCTRPRPRRSCRG